MLFRRREPPDLLERIHVLLWPRRSWSRSFRYLLLRLWRIPGTPHSIALGCAVGVFAIFTPFLGFQMLMAALMAWTMRGSVMASAIGTCAGNPLTYPLIWLGTFALGNLLIGGAASAHIDDFPNKAEALGKGIKQLSPEAIGSAIGGLWPVLKPMAIGSLPLGSAAAALIYMTVRRFIEDQKARRWQRVARRHILSHSVPQASRFESSP
jgi:uncharacterized protein (DUF2062 family)